MGGSQIVKWLGMGQRRRYKSMWLKKSENG
jgi:hypothetical protein